MLNIKKFFEKLKKNKKNNFCDEIFKNFLESDIQGSEMILEEIFKKIKNPEKQEFVGNSFELKFSKKSVKFFNEYTKEKCEMSLEKFEKKLKNI